MKIIKELIPYVIIIIFVIIIRSFLITPIMVNGNSMASTLKSSEVLLLNKMDKKYKRFDIVVVDYDDGKFKEKIIKRVIGLPGEKIKYNNGKLYVNDKKVKDKFSEFTNDFSTQDLGSLKIPEDTYLVLGDNRNNSVDSRILGFIKKEDIMGKTNIRLFPFNKFGKID